MIDEPTQPLQLAARILKPASISEIRRAPVTASGWNILDRWAVNQPAELLALEAQGPFVLLDSVLRQQRGEQDTRRASGNCVGMGDTGYDSASWSV